MLLSKRCIYALRASLYLALTKTDGEYISIQKIATDLNISFHFLTKILQDLQRKNLVTSFRGPRGGVALARPVTEITSMDIIRAITGEDVFAQCIMGLPGCGSEAPCPMHEDWAKSRSAIENVFNNTSLAMLAELTAKKHLRLAEPERKKRTKSTTK